MRRSHPPLWLAAPSRYAALSQTAARLVLVVLGALMLLSLSALASPDPTAGSANAGGGDVALYGAIVDGVRHGGGYYPVAADALRAGGYPLRPFVTFRLPTLAVIEAALPAPVIAAFLYALGGGVMIAWYARLRTALRGPVAIAAALLLVAGGSVACWQAELAGFHEVWAGLLIALSLARYAPGRLGEAIGWALAAALIRETAALYLIVMAAFAWREGRGREAAGWSVALIVLAMALAAHAHAVMAVVRPLDPASPGWVGLLGPGFVVRAAHAGTALSLLPLGLAAPLVALAWWGWSAWAHPLGLRVATTVGAYMLLLSMAGRVDTFYWGLLFAPVLLLGLVFAPDGVRDLVASALDRRRIVVRRVNS